MASYFIIEKPCERCEMLYDGVPIVPGQKYDFANQDKMAIVNTSGFKAVPADSFTYKVEVDGVISQNSSTVTVNFTPDYTGEQPDVTHNIDMEIYEEKELASYIPYSDTSDRIVVASISGKGYFTVNGVQVMQGESIFFYNISDFKFIASDEGAQEDYAVLVFHYANDQAESGKDSQISFHTSSLAVLVSDFEIRNTSADGKFKRRFTFSIEKQIVGKDFDISVDTTGVTFPMDLNNDLIITTEDFEYKIITNSVTPMVETNNNSSGRMLFTCEIKSDIDFTPSDEIVFTLLSIDGDPLLVDLSNNTLTFNLE